MMFPGVRYDSLDEYGISRQSTRGLSKTEKKAEVEAGSPAL